MLLTQLIDDTALDFHIKGFASREKQALIFQCFLELAQIVKLVLCLVVLLRSIKVFEEGVQGRESLLLLLGADLDTVGEEMFNWFITIRILNSGTEDLDLEAAFSISDVRLDHPLVELCVLIHVQIVQLVIGHDLEVFNDTRLPHKHIILRIHM